MVINWYGEACFKIQSGNTVLLTDPFEAKSGLTPPRFKADIILRTKTAFPIPYEISQENFIIDGPGEYEVKGFEITGLGLPYESSKDEMKSVYVVKTEDLQLGFLGHMSMAPEGDVLEFLGDIDILFVPAGGEPYIKGEQVAKLIRQMSPKVVVPSLFKTPNLKRAAGDIKEFLKDIDMKATPQDKLVVKKKDLGEHIEIYVPNI